MFPKKVNAAAAANGDDDDDDDNDDGDNDVEDDDDDDGDEDDGADEEEDGDDGDDNNGKESEDYKGDSGFNVDKRMMIAVRYYDQDVDFFRQAYNVNLFAIVCRKYIINQSNDLDVMLSYKHHVNEIL